MCAVLEFPVSAYYAVKKREHKPSARDVRDERLKEQIMRVSEDREKGRGLYGARKVWLQLRREGIGVARCTVERLMRDLGIGGMTARRKKRGAEAANSLYKKELINHEGPWQNAGQVTMATAEWVAWYNENRLHSACGNVPPEEYENDCQASNGHLIIIPEAQAS